MPLIVVQRGTTLLHIKAEIICAWQKVRDLPLDQPKSHHGNVGVTSRLPKSLRCFILEQFASSQSF